MSAFHHEFLVIEAKSMKEKVGQAVFTKELEAFKLMQGHIGELSKFSKRLLGMHGRNKD